MCEWAEGPEGLRRVEEGSCRRAARARMQLRAARAEASRARRFVLARCSHRSAAPLLRPERSPRLPAAGPAARPVPPCTAWPCWRVWRRGAKVGFSRSSPLYWLVRAMGANEALCMSMLNCFRHQCMFLAHVRQTEKRRTSAAARSSVARSARPAASRARRRRLEAPSPSPPRTTTA